MQIQMRTFTWIYQGSLMMKNTPLLALVSVAYALLAQHSAKGNTADSAVAKLDAWPKAASPIAMTSAKTEADITALIAKMTVEQKVGQIIQADISAISPSDLNTYPLGSILAGGNSGPNGNERATAAQWKALVDAFRSASVKSGAAIPILFGVDAVHGHSNLPGATIFPHNIGLGAARDPALIQRIGAATAAEIAGSGIEWTFAPTLAVPQDVRWGRAYEGYSSDPALVARYSGAMTLGLQGQLLSGRPLPPSKVAATAKHFLADGGTVDGRDQGDATISEKDLVALHAQGYPPAINAGALTVMASFSSWNGAKHHGNRSLLTDVLKNRMGFQGLVVGDWNGHGQVAGCSNTDCADAINAGLDLFMAPDSWKPLFESTVKAARDGRIPQARLDDAVRRILRVKYKLGLMGDRIVERGNTAVIGSAAHLDLAREAVAKSLVLLKNNKSVLPLRPGSNVLIAGPGADNMAMQAGGWTISWQGTDTKAEDFPKGQTLGKAIAQAVKSAGGTAELSPTGAYKTKPDTAIVVLGERPYAEFEGDVPHLNFEPNPADLKMIEGLKAKGVPLVVLFLSGRPMFTGKLMNLADGFVAGWLPGSQGQGVADVLVAGRNGKTKRDFTGKLPFAWPADANAAMTKPLFALGHGLNYRTKTQIGRVNEDAGVALSDGNASPLFMRRGKVPAPWRLVLDGSVTSRAVDLGAQEDARQFTWVNTNSFGVEGPAINLTQALEAGHSLLIDWRIDTLTNGSVKLAFGGADLDLSAELANVQKGKAIQTRIPLRCFKDKGANLTTVGSVLRLQANIGTTITLRDLRIEPVKNDRQCPA
jgi:beta-glucosidase